MDGVHPVCRGLGTARRCAGPRPRGGGLGGWWSSRWSPSGSGFASRVHSRAQKRGRAPWVSNSAQASLSSMKIIRACCSYGCPAACGSGGEGSLALCRPGPAPARPAWRSPCPGGRPARPGGTASSPGRASPGRPCPRAPSGSRRPTARCAAWRAGRGCSSPCPRSTPGAAGRAGAADRRPGHRPRPGLQLAAVAQRLAC